jgi:hypothetical protein
MELHPISKPNEEDIHRSFPWNRPILNSLFVLFYHYDRFDKLRREWSRNTRP